MSPYYIFCVSLYVISGVTIEFHPLIIVKIYLRSTVKTVARNNIHRVTSETVQTRLHSNLDRSRANFLIPGKSAC